MTPRPFTLVAELTHRCPLACPYCSNPTVLAAAGAELPASAWARVFREADALGVVQVHLTGGEPLLREDLEELVTSAKSSGLYVNLVTSGVPLARARWQALARAGVEHVQLSLQASSAELSDRIAGRKAYEQKLAAIAWIQETSTPLTLNFVLHRQSVELVERAIEFAERHGIKRLELAHTQYHGHALSNREALLPSEDAIERARSHVKAARVRLAQRMQITHVLPDYHAGRPRACMDGWGRRYVHVSPDGAAAPCHAARSIPGLALENVGERSLSFIWHESPSFNLFRGYEWMKDPCRTCERREQDFGGCRCQAFALTGDAAVADPVCALAPGHGLVLAARKAAARQDAEALTERFAYRSGRPERARLVTLRRPGP